MPTSPSHLPLSARLSQALAAFTMECDNEFEHRMPHQTSDYGVSKLGAGPWLTSSIMWWNCLRFVGEEGVGVGDLENLARTGTNLHGMQRWGYIVVEPDPGAGSKSSRAKGLIRAKARGRAARDAWPPIIDAIERRWQERFGKAEMRRLREALCALLDRVALDLPDCLPILGYGLFTQGRVQVRAAREGRQGAIAQLALPALLSRVLIAFALDFERESEISLAISANLLRILDEDGVRVRDLPVRSGVSKESQSMAMGILKKARVAVVENAATGARTKVIRLTAKGLESQEAYRRLLAALEKRWETQFGADTLGGLRTALDPLTGDGGASSPLFRGLEPYPDGWRAKVPRPEILPHYPMVLHRGGYPDGS
jgi:DNA-binding MarR family transcriptional regulator